MNKTLIIIVLAVGLIVATVFFLNKAKALKQDEQNPTVNPWLFLLPNGTGFPLTKGSKGIAVKMYQHQLGIKEDGIFGNQTYNALLMDGYNGTVTKEQFVNYWINSVINDEKDLFPIVSGANNTSVWVVRQALQLDENADLAQYLKEKTGKPQLTLFDFKEITKRVFGLEDRDFNF